jgi:flagellar biosynthesis/type III secretory pathway protein FliH
MEQTAVEWFVEQLPIRILNLYQDEIIKAKAMEKEQIKKERVEAYDNGYANGQKDAYTN